MDGARPSYRRALKNRDFRLLMGALTQSMMGDWAYNVALVVYVFDKTHSAGWVAASTLGRMLPRLVVAPYGGVIAERFERVRLMVTSDLIRAALMASLAVVTGTDGPAWAAIAIAGAISVASCPYDPATAAMLPQLLGEDDLAAGNALTETINNVAIIGGPAIGAIVLAFGSPSGVMAIDTVTFLISAFLVSRMTARSTPSDVSSEGGPLSQIAVGVRAIAGSASAVVLVSFTVVTTLLYGADTVLFVPLSRDKLDTGTDGYGYLLVALGVGGVIAATFVNRLAALPRLSLVLSVGMIVYAAPTAVLVAVHSPAVAFGVEVVRGVATLVVDVIAMTALQRSLAPEMIARVFGIFWALIVGGLSLGAFVMPFVLDAAGLDGTILLDGLVVPVAVVLVYPKLASLDRIAAARAEELAPRVRVLESLQLFAAAPRRVLERLAQNATELVVEPGTVIIQEGAEADALFVLVEGQLTVKARGDRARARHLEKKDAPSFVGEIGIIGKMPRTATVTAVTACRLLRIEADDFLDALSQTSPSPTFVAVTRAHLAKTLPGRTITIPGEAERDEPALH